MIDDGTRTGRDAGTTPGHDATVSAAGVREAPVMWRRLEGALVYDSREQSAAGVRVGKRGLPRLMYRAGGSRSTSRSAQGRQPTVFDYWDRC
jgi:hypothetical protein